MKRPLFKRTLSRSKALLMGLLLALVASCAITISNTEPQMRVIIQQIGTSEKPKSEVLRCEAIHESKSNPESNPYNVNLPEEECK